MDNVMQEHLNICKDFHISIEIIENVIFQFGAHNRKIINYKLNLIFVKVLINATKEGLNTVNLSIST